MEFPKTLQEAAVKFADPDYALAFMRDLRWPNGVECPFCGSQEYSFLKTRRIWKCSKCRKQFSVKRGTIFEDSPIGLDKWLLAIWLVANAKNGISSHELKRALGLTQKTTWFMAHRIRLAMQSNTFAKLSGTIEADETFIGGKKDRRQARNRNERRGPSHLSPVLGMLQRGGEVINVPILTPDRTNIHYHVQENVEPGSNLYTDKWGAYRGLEKLYKHEWVNHVDEWVRGDVHSNNIESYWALLKRSIKGTWIRPTPKHLFRYLDDQAYRYNFRKLDDAGRFIVAAMNVAGKRIQYDQLTGKKAK